MRYTFTDEDRQKRSGRRRLEVIEILSQGPATPDDVAEKLGIHRVSAYYVLERLVKRGIASRDAAQGTLKATYRIDDGGLEKIDFLIKREERLSKLGELETLEKLERLYPDDYALGELVKGPVAVMRLVEVDELTFRRAGVAALPSRVTLVEGMLWIEKKYDGWLVQVAGGRLYSRRGKELTQNFSPITREVAKFRGEHLVGELVFWTKKGTDEGKVTAVAGTADPLEAMSKFKALEKEGFYQIVAFDLIAHQGKDISKRPLEERRKALETLVKTTDDRRERITLTQIWPYARWEKVFTEALAEGGEGIVVKNKQAPHVWRPLGQPEARPVGNMWKVKRIRSDNFIASDPHRSEKQKLMVVLSQFWKGELIPIQDLDNFSLETENEMLRRIKQGGGMVLIEVAFQERFGDPPCRLRNGVFMRFRTDVPLTSAQLPPECAPR